MGQELRVHDARLESKRQSRGRKIYAPTLSTCSNDSIWRPDGNQALVTWHAVVSNPLPTTAEGGEARGPMEESQLRCWLSNSIGALAPLERTASPVVSATALVAAAFFCSNVVMTRRTRKISSGVELLQLLELFDADCTRLDGIPQRVRSCLFCGWVGLLFTAPAFTQRD